MRVLIFMLAAAFVWVLPAPALAADAEPAAGAFVAEALPASLLPDAHSHDIIKGSGQIIKLGGTVMVVGFAMFVVGAYALADDPWLGWTLMVLGPLVSVGGFGVTIYGASPQSRRPGAWLRLNPASGLRLDGRF